MQQAMFGDTIMPENELMIWTAGVTQWIEWYDYVKESGSWYDTKCPDYIKDSPDMYNSWLEGQKNTEKNKNNKPYGSN